MRKLLTAYLVLFASLNVSFAKDKIVEEVKPNLDDPKVQDAIIAVAATNLQERKKLDGSYIAYLPRKQTPYTGWEASFHDNGQIDELIQFKDGKRDGLQRRWSKNGQKESERTFKDGKKDGPATYWNSNGQKSLEVTYKDGELFRETRISYYKNWQKESERTFKDGEEDGPQTWFYSNGQKRVEGTIKDGKLWTAVVWKRNGEKCPVTNVKDGNGVLVGYNDDGTESERQTFKDGKPVIDQPTPTKSPEVAKIDLDDNDTRLPPTRAITRGPKHHWFGYYDKLQFDPTSRYVLGMEVDFQHRSPTGKDVITVGMVDLDDGDRWIPFGQSKAWNWQQGCMLQWLPGSKTQVLWNDRQGDRFVCHIYDIKTKQRRTIPHAIYSVSPDGKSAVAPDFRRIGEVRPGYGYAGLPDPHADDLAPKASGIFHIDLETGESKLIIPLADIARVGVIPQAKFGIKHYFNHLLYSPDGSRFITLHRWRYPDGSRLTRMITARPDGTDVRIVIPNGYASHFIWRDPHHILSQSRHYAGTTNWSNFLFQDKEMGQVEEVGAGILDGSGHLSYLPGNKWILNDTYPKGKERLQTPHLYHVKTKRRIDLGHFHLPAIYTGEWRVDTHPRFSPDSRYVCIDAPDGKAGRQLHLIDIRGLLD